MPRKSTQKPVQVDEMFAAYDTTGKLLYITLRPSRRESEAALYRINPRVEGFDYDYAVKPVRVCIDEGRQYDLEERIGRAGDTSPR